MIGPATNLPIVVDELLNRLAKRPELRPLLHEHHRKKLSTPHRRAECFRVAAWYTRTNTTTAKAQLMIDVMTSTEAGRVTPV
jgi:hypothetical protein